MEGYIHGWGMHIKRYIYEGTCTWRGYIYGRTYIQERYTHEGAHT